MKHNKYPSFFSRVYDKLLSVIDYLSNMGYSEITEDIYLEASALLTEIYDRGTSTVTILRKARIIVAKLGYQHTIGWIDKETGGYDTKDQFPSYRCVTSTKTITYDYKVPIPYFVANKEKLLKSSFGTVNLFQKVTVIESYLAKGGVWFKGTVIDTTNGVDVYEKDTIDGIALQQVLDSIQERVVKDLEGIIVKYSRKKTSASVQFQRGDLEGILRRFNDFRKYDKEKIENESDVRKEMYKILKPTYPDLLDEEYLQRFGEKNPKPDFVIPSLKILLEDKFASDEKSLDRIQDEILADIPSYLENNKDRYDGLIVFIYSKVHVSTDFISNLEKQKGILRVIVANAPAV